MYPDPEEQVNRVEIEAMEASLPDVGAIVAEIGMDKPLKDYQREEILRLIFTAYTATRRHFLDIVSREMIPLPIEDRK